MKLTDEMGIAAAAGLEVKLTSPDRLVYPEAGVTKARLAAYYAAVAERMLAHLGRRLLSIVRGPDGVAGHHFYQKHAARNFPSTFHPRTIIENDGETKDYMYVEDTAGLLAGVQMSTLEFHVWGSSIDDLERPERVVFDIDPDEEMSFTGVCDAARRIRDALGDWGLESYPMVTGGKGIHVIAPLQPVAEWPAVKDYCQAFAKTLERDDPDRFTANIRKAKRGGKVFVDYLRNERGSTAVCPWSTRAKPAATVAVPVSWDELGSFKSAGVFSLDAAAERSNAADPWPGYLAPSQSITPAMVDAATEPFRRKGKRQPTAKSSRRVPSG
jgi:bifunctional non-homologous end joining protein LigD